MSGVTVLPGAAPEPVVQGRSKAGRLPSQVTRIGNTLRDRAEAAKRARWAAAVKAAHDVWGEAMKAHLAAEKAAEEARSVQKWAFERLQAVERQAREALGGRLPT